MPFGKLIVEASTVVLVEGVSDQRAVQALAERHDRDLGAEGVSIVSMGGATNIARYLEIFGPQGLDVALAGLCDEGEVSYFQRGLERIGLGANLTRSDIEALHFYVCRIDLEDELIRGLGVAAVENILAEQGDLASFRIFQRQPAQRGRSDEARLRRFMGTRGGRKVHYASVLVRALDLAFVPAPLERLLAHI